jgi:hypothetical protein
MYCPLLESYAHILLNFFILKIIPVNYGFEKAKSINC